MRICCLVNSASQPLRCIIFNKCASGAEMCLCVASFVLQGPVGAEEVPYPDPSQSQQPRAQHSFVQEHFQAQYK